MDPEKPALAELATAPSAGSSQDKDTAPAPGHLTFDASEKQGKATGAGFPRVGTRELRKELTQDDRDLAQAGYSDLATKKASEETHVDIVRAAVRTELADSCRRSSASRPISSLRTCARASTSGSRPNPRVSRRQRLPSVSSRTVATSSRHPRRKAPGGSTSNRSRPSSTSSSSSAESSSTFSSVWTSLATSQTLYVPFRGNEISQSRPNFFALLMLVFRW